MNEMKIDCQNTCHHNKRNVFDQLQHLLESQVPQLII
jgi:hypothetical protein